MAGKTRKAGRKTRGGAHCNSMHKKGSGYRKSKKHGGKKRKRGGMSILATLKQALPSYLLYQAVEMQKKRVHKRKTKEVRSTSVRLTRSARCTRSVSK